MHVSIFGVVICSVLLLAWGVLRLHSRRSVRRRSARWTDWRELVRRYPDLDRELDRFWYRRDGRLRPAAAASVHRRARRRGATTWRGSLENARDQDTHAGRRTIDHRTQLASGARVAAGHSRPAKRLG